MSTVLRGEFASTKTCHFIAGQTYYIPAGPFSKNAKCLLAVFWQNCRSQNIADSILAILSVQSKYGQSDTRNVKRSYWKTIYFLFRNEIQFPLSKFMSNVDRGRHKDKGLFQLCLSENQLFPFFKKHFLC